MAAIDLDAIAEGAARRVAERLLAELPDLVRRALDERAQALEPLAKILNCSTRAAAARIRRDAGLRALGVPVGHGRLLFRAAEVQQYLRGGGR